MFLFINTASSEKIVLALVDKGGQILKLKKIVAKFKQSEKLLPSIEKLLGGNLKKLKGIIAVKGPGSFTGLRVGLSVANTMAWALRIPVIGVKWEERQKEEDLIKDGVKKIKKIKKFRAVLPEYGKEPNISISKASKYSKVSKADLKKIGLAKFI